LDPSTQEERTIENAKVYKELRRGRIEPSLASRLSQILINQRVILESWDAQKLIEKLEALLEAPGRGKLRERRSGGHSPRWKPFCFCGFPNLLALKR
jgi:hypothetical protein